MMHAHPWGLIAGAVGLIALLSACERPAPCANCDTLVIAATGEPASLLPPLVVETVGRDISDQVFERLADLALGGAPIDSTAYQPRLADHWARVDSLSWRFHLRPGARWSDGVLVRAEDVVFSFTAFGDAELDAPARPYLEGMTARAEDSATVLIRFSRPYAEQLYDATYHVRVFPEHVWGKIPIKNWRGDTVLGHLVGSGPYRVTRWTAGQAVILEADSTAARKPKIRRAVWRFAEDPDAALNLVLSHEADLLETLGGPDRVSRVSADSTLTVVRYPSAAAGFLGFQLGGGGSRSGVLSDRNVRRALTQAIDRASVARAVFGPDAKAPPGPMSQVLWIWDDGISVLPFDPAAAARTLEAAGWRVGAGGTRMKSGQPLLIDILVPGTSVSRKRMAEVIQESWRGIGARATITAVDFPVFQQRLTRRQFEAYLGAWLDEPTPRGLADQWTRAGFAALNYGRYANPVFDSLFHRAAMARSVAEARPAWREAMDTLNADAPAIFLYAPTNVAAVSRRVRALRIDPYSWMSGLAEWEVEQKVR